MPAAPNRGETGGETETSLSRGVQPDPSDFEPLPHLRSPVGPPSTGRSAARQGQWPPRGDAAPRSLVSRPAWGAAPMRASTRGEPPCHHCSGCRRSCGTGRA